MIFERDKNLTKVLLPTYFEDTSGLRFANKADGLWGVELLNRKNKISLFLNILIQLIKIVTHHMLTNHTTIIQNTLWGGVIKDMF